MFHGKSSNVDITDVAVAYIGTSYRVAVIMRITTNMTDDLGVRAFADELFGQRVVLPR